MPTKSKILYTEAEKLVKEAVESILAKGLQSEEIPVMESIGRVLNEDIYADMSIPPFACSAMDGYAVIAADLKESSKDKPKALESIEEIPAGLMPYSEITRGQTSRIMTGAPIPKGADTVIMVEDTTIEGKKVFFHTSASTGKNVREIGEDIKEGELVIKKGTSMRPQEIAILATLGKSRINVTKRPVVAVIATGSELVDIDKKPSGGEIRNSNSYMISSLVEKYGGKYIDLGIVGDDKEVIGKVIKKGLKADIFISTGGVSVGDYDYVKDVMKDVGVNIIFDSIKIKPGKPVSFGRYKSCLVFALPGYPVSSFTSFELLARPSILALQGKDFAKRKKLRGVMKKGFKKKQGRLQVIPAWASYQDGEYLVEVRRKLGSGMLTSLCDANCFIFCEASSEGFAPGQSVDIELF